MTDISAINPYIRVAMHSVIPAGIEINRRIIFDYELIYLENGALTLNYNEVDYCFRKGQFILLRPGVSHSLFNIKSDLSQPHIHFDINHIANSEQVPVSFKDMNALNAKEKAWIRNDIFIDYPKEPTIVFSDTEKALTLFFEVIDNPALPLTRKAKLIQLLEMLLLDNFPGLLKQQQPARLIEKSVKEYIDAGQGFAAKLEDIAKQFNYNKYYLDHRFRESYGVGIIAYRNEKRMQMAKKMLPHNTVSAVSEKLGFSSVYVFSRAFKNHFGISPTEALKQ